MAFELKSVVPWGRNLAEYQLMFNLTEADLGRRIISFGDGPAGFNAQMHELGRRVVSLDPIYQFSREELAGRIRETRDEVLAQVERNRANFVWTHIRDVADLENIRMGAMNRFLADYEAGRREGRYVPHALPDRTPYADDAFDLGLSSHFLVLYVNLGLDFHVQALREMLRVCREVRIFPLLDLNAGESAVLPGITEHFGKDYTLSVEPVAYAFQRNGNRMLRIVKGNHGPA
jgi:SAM-dependent methyltransferase